MPIAISQGIGIYQGARAAGVVFTDDITDGAGTPVAITTSIAARQVYQRGRSTINLAGTYSTNGGDPTRMVWRCGAGPWVAFTGQAVGGGNWSGTFRIPSNYLAQGTLEVKPENGLNVTPAQVLNITITDVFVVNGQSNADGAATNNQSYVKTNFDWLVAANGGAWAVKTIDPTWNSAGSIWPAFAELLDQAGIPPAFVNGATIDGSGFNRDDWNPGDTLYNQAVSRLDAALTDTGGCRAEIWWQGEAESVDDVAAGYYFDAMVARRNGFDGAITNFDSSIPTYCFQFGENNGAGIDKVRADARRLREGEDSRFKPGPNLLMSDWGDGVHAGVVGGNVDAAEAEAQLDRIASWLYRSIVSDGPAPIIVSVDADDTDATKVNAVFNQAMENHTSTHAWTVTDEGGEVQITAAAQGAGSSDVVLTTIRDCYGAVTVDFGKGGSAQAPIEDIDTVLRQATAVNGVKIAPEPHLNLDAGTAIGSAPSSLIVNGTFDSDLSGWSQTGTTWFWDNGTAEIDIDNGGGGAVFLDQSASAFIAGETYEISLAITERVSGNVSVRILGDTQANTVGWNTVGSHSDQIVCPANPVTIRLVGNAVARLNVDNVSAVQV